MSSTGGRSFGLTSECGRTATLILLAPVLFVFGCEKKQQDSISQDPKLVTATSAAVVSNTLANQIKLEVEGFEYSDEVASNLVNMVRDWKDTNGTPALAYLQTNVDRARKLQKDGKISMTNLVAAEARVVRLLVWCIRDKIRDSDDPKSNFELTDVINEGKMQCVSHTMLVCILARSLGFKKVDPWWADMNSIRQHQKSIPPDVPSHIFPLVHLSNQEVIIADGALCSNLDFTHVSKPFKLEDAYEPEPVGKCLRLKNPNNPALFHGRIRETKDLAMLWNNRGLRDSNPESLTNALAYDPDLADAHVNLAEHLRKSGDLSQAMSHFKRAIDIDPKCVPAGYYCMLAEFYSNSNRWDDALAIMTNATMLNLQDPLFRYCRATVFGSRGLFYLKSGKWKEAIEDLTKEADLNPNGRAYCDLTYAHAKLREWHKARDTSIKAIALDPAFAAKSFALLKEELLKDASDTSTTTVELRSAITNLVHHIDGKLKASQK